MVACRLGKKPATHTSGAAQRPFTPAELANAVTHAESIDRPMQAFLDMEQQLNESLSMYRELTQPTQDAARRVAGIGVARPLKSLPSIRPLLARCAYDPATPHLAL